MQILLLAAYCSVLFVLCAYGAHRAHHVYQCYRHRRRIDVGQRRIEITEEALPTVTVQLPIFNEATVAARLIEATGRLDYPAHKLEIQVLDDSTDETLRIAREAVDSLKARGKARKVAEEATEYAALSPAQFAARIKAMEQKMYQHARDLEFEQAATVRDQLRRLREAGFAA